MSKYSLLLTGSNSLRARLPATGPARLRCQMSTAVWMLSWSYFVLLLAFWLFVRWQGDQSAVGTMMLFGPVWFWVLPAVFLIPWAVAMHRRALFALVPALLISLFAVSGVCFPWRRLLPHPVARQHVRVLTCNTNRGALNDAALAKLVAQVHPDIVALQEWVRDDDTPAFADGSWHTFRSNELLIASRFPIEPVATIKEPQWNDWGGVAVQCDIATPTGVVHFFNLHLASPHQQFKKVIKTIGRNTHAVDEHLKMRAEQSREISSIAAGVGPGAIIAGDFNSIAEGTIYRQYWSPFQDAFVTAGWGPGQTYFYRGAWVRIDHVLASDDFHCTQCWVGADVGSPHRPVIADLER